MYSVLTTSRRLICYCDAPEEGICDNSSAYRGSISSSCPQMLAGISRFLTRRRPPFPLAATAAAAAMSSSSSTAANISERPISPDTTRVAWVGTGVMGQSMAGHLLAAGYALTVFNRTASKTQGLVSRGASLADSPRAAAAAADVIFLMVGFPSDVRSTALDPSRTSF